MTSCVGNTLALVLFSLLTISGAAWADDDPMAAMQVRGALAAARAIVAAQRCPSLSLRQDKLDHFLSLVDQTATSPKVRAGVTSLEAQFGRMSEGERIAFCVAAFDDFSPCMSGLLVRDGSQNCMVP